jgi:hypothetical protein
VGGVGATMPPAVERLARKYLRRWGSRFHQGCISRFAVGLGLLVSAAAGRMWFCEFKLCCFRMSWQRFLAIAA